MRDDSLEPTSSFGIRLAKLTLAVAESDIPTAAIGATCGLVQHAFGVAAVGSDLPVSVRARDAFRGCSEGACLVFGEPEGWTSQDAAFANGVASHASLLEDAGPGGMRAGSHPATYIFPAALAVAQERRSSGAAFVRAVCAAYEAVDRLGSLIPPEVAQRGFRPVPMLGPFGAVAVAAVLSKLDLPQLVSAYGIAANLAGGLNQGFVDGTMEPYLHPAFAARNGLLAVRLAAAGCTASPNSLDGERGFLSTFGANADQEWVAPKGHFETATSELAVCRVGAKHYATCLYNQGTLALIRSRLASGLAAEAIERVTLARPGTGLHGLAAPGVATDRFDGSPLQLQMSARFTAAAALLGRPVESAAWFQHAADDAHVDALARRIDLVRHDSPGIRIDILMRDGERRSAEAGAETVLEFSAARIDEAFQRRVRPLLGEHTARASELLAALPRLDSIEPLTSLFKTMRKPDRLFSARNQETP